MRSLGSKDLSGHQEFATSEDVPDASKMCQAVVLEMPSEPKPGPHSIVLPGQHVWAFFDSAMTIVHLDYARMVSGNDSKTGKYWIGIEFPLQDIDSMPPDTHRRPGSKAELRNTAPHTYSHMSKPYGTRFTDLLGHATLGSNIAADDELIETIKQYVPTMLRMSQKTVCKDDPRAVESQSAYTPSTHQSILGQSPVDDEDAVTTFGGAVTAGPLLEAYSFSNAYVPADDKTGGMTWMMDLLESCPLYQAIRTVWTYTQIEFTRDKYVDRNQPDLFRIPSFKTNLRWVSQISPIHSIRMVYCYTTGLSEGRTG
jgi:hypothetical protein